MIELLSPVSKKVVAFVENLPSGSLGKLVKLYQKKGQLPDFAGAKFALLGVLENRNNVGFDGETLSFDPYRKAFYSLFPGNWPQGIIDLGDIAKGDSVSDTQFALKTVVSVLLKNKIIPLILGGGQDLAYAQYRAYDGLGEMVNLANVDSKFDLGDSELPMTNKSYVGKIVVTQPYNLFNYSVLGYQSYFNSPDEISLMEKLFFDAYRLGEITADLTLAEPILRDADLVTLDITAIKSPDLSYGNNGGPNGFDGREICALSRYAGLSNRVSSFGIYELTGDSGGNGPLLTAQILWYFVEGASFRVEDEDFANDRLFTNYKVPVDGEVLLFKKKQQNRTVVAGAAIYFKR